MDNSTKQIREHIIRQIQVVLSESLPDVGSGTMRILGDIPNSILDPEDYLKSIHPFLSEIEEYLQKYIRRLRLVWSLSKSAAGNTPIL